jgi:polyisoprenoid-binding protein YceI
MSAPTRSSRTAPRNQPSGGRKKVLLLGAAALVVAALAVGGYGIWYLFLRPGGPPAVGTGSPQIPAGASITAPASMDGAWIINTSLGNFGDYSNSWVGYRVQEQLGGIGANTAVGRTPGVSGSLTLSGATITATTITADMAGLVSGDPNRDGQLQRQAIETDLFPTATFTLTKPIDLGSIPPDGQTVAVTATGSLTLHGVTRTADITLQAERQGGIIAVTGSLPIVFSDYSIQRPTSFAVLSVDDHGTMELHLLFTHV